MRCIGYQLRSRVRNSHSADVNRVWLHFTKGKYWKSVRKLFHITITRRMRLLFQLNDGVFPKDLTQYLSGYNLMIERIYLSR